MSQYRPPLDERRRSDRDFRRPRDDEPRRDWARDRERDGNRDSERYRNTDRSHDGNGAHDYDRQPRRVSDGSRDSRSIRSPDRGGRDASPDRRPRPNDNSNTSSPVNPLKRNSSLITTSAGQGTASGRASPRSTTSKSPIADGAVARTPREEAIMRMIDQMSKRQYWYMQRDRALKDKERLAIDIDKTRVTNSDFAGAVQVLDAERKKVERTYEKSHCRMTDITTNLLKEFTDLMNNVASAQESRQPAAADMESKISRSVEAAVKSQLAAQNDGIEAKIQSRVDKQCAGIKSKLEEYEKKNYELEAKLEALVNVAKAANEGRSTVEQDVAKVTAQLEKHSAQVQQQFETEQEATAKVLQLEQRMAQMQQQFETEQQVASRVPPLEQQMAELKQKVETDNSHDIVQPPAKDLETIHNDMSALRSWQRQVDRKLDASWTKVSALESEVSDLPISDLPLLRSEVMSLKDQLRSASLQAPSDDMAVSNPPAPAWRESLAKVQAQLHKFSDGFGKLIDGERQARIVLDISLRKIDQNVSAMQQQLSETSEIQARASPDVRAQLGKLGNDVVSTQNQSALLSNRLDQAQSNLRAYYEDTMHQLHSVTTWQANFNMANLWQGIVQHLSTYVPQVVDEKLHTVTSRLDALENHLGYGEGASAKRRRVLLNGNAVSANGSPAETH